MKIKIELMGALVDYLPESEQGRATLSLKNKATVADLLAHLQIKQRVAVAVNGVQDQEIDHPLADGDEVLVFTGVSGG